MDNRTDAIITLNATSPNCNYPGPNWVKTIVNCTEIWNATIPWQIAYQECGLNRTETNQSIIFDGWIDIFQQDILGIISGTPITRNLSTNFEYKVVFPKTFSTQSYLQVLSPVSVNAAIVSESFDVASIEGKLNLFTSVEWPFELVQPQISINNTQLLPRITNLSQDCSYNTACNENWNIAIALSNICDFSGTYAVTFQIVCNPSFFGQCPLQGQNATIIFSIVSQDVCGVFNENIDLSCNFGSYLSDFTTQSTSFIVGQESYWKLDMSSTKATIISTQLQYCSVSAPPSLYNATLYDPSQITPYGSLTNFSSISTSATEVRFRFNIDPRVFTVTNSQTSFATVFASVSVIYQNTQQQKRSILRELLLQPVLSNNKNNNRQYDIYHNSQNAKRQIPPQAQFFSSSSVMTVQSSPSATQSISESSSVANELSDVSSASALGSTGVLLFMFAFAFLLHLL